MKKSVLVAACVVVGSISYPALSPAAVSPDPSPYKITIDDEVPPADRATLDEIRIATLRVIGSRAFADHLAAVEHENLWLGTTGPALPPREVAEIYRVHRDSIRSAPAVLTRTRKWFSGAPITGLYAGPPEGATITLSMHELEHWRTGTPVGRSCAVNTLAHEISHTISRASAPGRYVFSDRGKQVDEHPLASYIVGHVAQCTMLEDERALDVSFAECVRKWGTNTFLTDDCA